MQPPIEPFTEPWHATALRTGGLALLVGAGAGLGVRRPAMIPLITLLALWFTLGGHFFELLFRNQLRRYLGDSAALPALARVAFWFATGVLLFGCAQATRALLTGRTTVPISWWLVGSGFVGVELLIHLGLRVRGLPSIYNGRG